MRIEEYLTVLTGQVRCKRAREGIARELRSHLEDQQLAYEQEGLNTEQAEILAVKEMGSPVETGVELDRIHRPRMAWGMIALICGISIAGFAVQHTLQMNFSKANFFPFSGQRYLLHMVAGLLLMTGICFLDYSRIRFRAREIAIVLFVLLLLQVSLFGMEYNGQKAWIRLGTLSIDVRQVLFLFVPLYGAILYGFRGQGYGALLKAAIWMLPANVIALSCPSMVTAVMLTGSFLIVLTTAMIRNWFQIAKVRTLAVIWSAVLLFPAAGVLLMLRSGKAYYTDRLNGLVGFSDEAGGYLIRTTREVVAGSQLIGSAGMPIEQMLPGSNDYVLTYFITCYGVLAAVILIGFIAALMFGLLRASLKQKNQLAVLMGVGSTVAIFLQVLMYVLANTGVIAMAAYCPFLNYGGSGTLATYALLGLLLSICRYESVISESALAGEKRPGWRLRLVFEKGEGGIGL